MILELPQIETKRLVLRPIEEEDACDIYEYYSNPQTTKFLSFKPHKDVDYTLHTIRCFYLSYQKHCIPQTWVIVWKENEKVIGSLNIHTIEDDIGEIGYVLHPAYWNQGIMKEALPHLVKASFEIVGLRRLQAYYDVHHIASEKVLEACGFQKEGVLRQYAKLSDGTYHDMVLTAILKEEWLKGVRK